MNWGWGIGLLYSGFVAMMLVMVVLSSRQDVPLVREDYYEHDLKYNDHIERVSKTKEMGAEVTVKQDAATQTVTLQFPTEMTEITGEVLCFRPSQEGLDFTLPLENLKGNQLTFRSDKMLKGRWKLKITWQNGGNLFYKELTISV